MVLAKLWQSEGPQIKSKSDSNGSPQYLAFVRLPLSISNGSRRFPHWSSIHIPISRFRVGAGHAARRVRIRRGLPIIAVLYHLTIAVPLCFFQIVMLCFHVL